MISYIKGQIIYKKDGYAVIENQGMGFKVFVSPKTAENLIEKQEVRLFTFLFTQNDKMELYGFLGFQELELFERLEKLSGVGPKAALKITALGNLEDLKKAVESNDQNYFAQVKGIGQKKIQKIILELGGSFKKFFEEENSQDLDSEAIKGLKALGFSDKEAKTALKKVSWEIKDPAKRVQEALKNFTQNND